MKVLQIIWKYESNATNNNPSQQSKFLIENELLAARAVLDQSVQLLSAFPW